ncbi:type 1 glutamine amidotransferase [Herbaspirillum robiniae]|uniref:Peptidase n=1 Tax=Herbaspirillum robiniae TaxID=2014887 RepID=A0A246WUF2_9BURK|nr:type 1 glutamine amidotransferase domain-containing protein [Herbaspirillum robiniae]NUU01275.1 type 1 glutamine amidotransferase [Herbaspirillum robiniae]OWY30700.1 peptidase [Herbaspirillum robiniae]
MAKRFNNLKVAVLVTDGFEQAELLEPKKALEAAGATVHILSDKKRSVQGFKHVDKGEVVSVDKTIDEARADDYSAVLLPGGVVNGDALRLLPQARNFVRAANDAEKPIASICHGGWLLISAGVAKGRTVTSWPSLQDDFKNAGSQWIDQEVVRDENFISSRKPADIPAFNNEFMKLLDEQQQRERKQPAPAAAGEEAGGDAQVLPAGGKKLSGKGVAPAAPPEHENEAFAVAHGHSHQSDG